MAFADEQSNAKEFLMDYFEIYKALGATFGFVATGFALWDRMLRYRPSVSITAEHTQSGNSRAFASREEPSALRHLN
jgi:hypothetical protein